MKMSHRCVAAGALAALSLAACGGSTPQTPTEQVKAVETAAIGALFSSDPGAVCKFGTDPGRCMAGVIMGKALGIHPADLIPSDWRARIARQTITFTDSTHATVPALSGQRPARYVRVDGRWLEITGS